MIMHRLRPRRRNEDSDAARRAVRLLRLLGPRVGPLLGLLAMVVVTGAPAWADSNTAAGLPAESANVKVQQITYENPHVPGHPSNGGDPLNDGDMTVTSVVMPTGGRWYLECPAVAPLAKESDTGAGSHTGINWPWARLNMNRDRCGSDGSGHYLGVSSWTTSGYSQVVVSPTDARCAVEVASRTDAFSTDVVGPVQCGNTVQMFPTLDLGQQTVMEQWLAATIGTCAGQSGLHLEQVPGGGTFTCQSKGDPARDLQYWPVVEKIDSTGLPEYVYLDCSRPPAGRVPAAWAAYAGGDPGKLGELCGLTNQLLRQVEGTGDRVPGVHFDTGAPTSGVVAPLHDAVASLLSTPPPLDSGGDPKLPGWVKVAVGVIGGCAVGGLGGLVVAGPVGAAGGCVLGGAAGAAVGVLADKLNCSVSDLSCIFKGLTAWAGRGMVKSLNMGLGALSGHVITGDVFSRDIFQRLWIAVLLLSAMALLVYGLLTVLVSVLSGRPGRMVHAAAGIAGWTVGLAAAIPLTVLLIQSADQAADYICRWGGGTFDTMGQRFQACITSVLNGGQFGDIADTLFGFALAVLGMLGGLWLLGFAVARVIGLAFGVIGAPLSLAASAGPRPVRRAPVQMLTVIVTLALFKIPAAIGLTFAAGMIGAGQSVMDLVIGLCALLIVCFAGWRMAGLIGGGLEHAAGEQTHQHVRAGMVGTVAAAASAGAVYHRMSRHGKTLLTAPGKTGAAVNRRWATVRPAEGGGGVRPPAPTQRKPLEPLRQPETPPHLPGRHRGPINTKGVPGPDGLHHADRLPYVPPAAAASPPSNGPKPNSGGGQKGDGSDG